MPEINVRDTVSICITTRNRKLRLSNAIQSALRQTYRYIEIVVVDDNSSDDSQAFVSELVTNKPFLKYVYLDENVGLAKARNIALNFATGDWIAYMDDDTEFLPDRISASMALVATNNISKEDPICLQCGVLSEKESGTVVRELPRNHGPLEASIKSNGLYTLQSSFLFSRKFLLEIKGFDERLKSSIDHDIWMKAAIHGCANFTLNECLVTIPYHEEPKMMMNTLQRIYGVNQFLDKWEDVFVAWYGQRGAKRFNRAYFTKVISRLLYGKIIQQDYKSSVKVFWQILLHNRSSVDLTLMSFLRAVKLFYKRILS